MKSVIQMEERLGFLLSAAACQYLLPVRSKSQFPEKQGRIQDFVQGGPEFCARKIRISY